MRIDVHGHYWPAAYLDALVAAGRTDLARAGRQVDDFDDRLATLDRNGVDLQLLSAIGLNTELPEPGPVGSVVIRLDPADPDRADVRAYVQVAHVLHGGPGGLPALAGGWYENIAVRTAEGWRFSRVRLAIAWNGERPMLPEGVGAGR